MQPMNLVVLRPLKAIRAKCVDCCGGMIMEVRRCQITRCALWPYRMGKRPKKRDARGGSGDPGVADGPEVVADG